MLDVHTHLLPALDDGLQTIADSITVLKRLNEFGFSHVVATPHFYPGRYTPSVQAIDVAMGAVREMLKRDGVSIELIRGRECYFDFELTTSPDRETFPFSWNGKRFLLLELPQITQPQMVGPYAAELSRSKITPILAHAERYERVISDPNRVEEYTQLGFRIQVDLLSFHSSAPEPMRKTALRLLETDRIDLVATDVHKVTQLDRLQDSIEFLRKEHGPERFLRYCTLS
jgi:protein-tyrosine phosphatase